MFIFFLFFITSDAVSTTTTTPATTNKKSLPGYFNVTYYELIEGLSNGNTQDWKTDEVCLKGYVKAIRTITKETPTTHSTTTLRLHDVTPISLQFTLCTPQKPVCMFRRDTTSLKDSEETSLYYRFGCRYPSYWNICESHKTKTDRSAIYCGTSVRDQLCSNSKTSTCILLNQLNDLLINNTIMGTKIRYVEMNEKRRRLLFEKDDRNHHEEQETDRTPKLYSLLVIMTIAGSYKIYKNFKKIFKKRVTQVDMDEPDKDDGYSTTMSSSTDSNLNY